MRKRLASVSKWLAKNWSVVLTSVVSVVALMISIITWYDGAHVKENYSNNVTSMIISSSKIVTYDLNLLEYKTLLITKYDGIYDERDLKFQVSSLETQLQIVKDVQITNLPRKDMLNYITYRSDLADSIYMLKSNMSGINNSQTNLRISNKKRLLMSPSEQKDLLGQIATAKKIMVEDSKIVKNGKSLYDVHYRDGNKNLERLLNKGVGDN